jgi:hypothetical protein
LEQPVNRAARSQRGGQKGHQWDPPAVQFGLQHPAIIIHVKTFHAKKNIKACRDDYKKNRCA